MKGYGVSDRKLERELILACRDEYEMRLADGAYEDEAFRAAVENIEEIAKSRISRRNKFAFALGMGILALCIPKRWSSFHIFLSQSQNNKKP